MSETTKIMTSLQFPGGVEPYVINDARIPRDPAPYQQLVTDGTGKAGWEQRLAWKEVAQKELFNQTVSFTFYSDANMCYSELWESPFGQFVIGEKYTVVWDGVEYPDLIAFDDENTPTIGSAYSEIGNELPFKIYTIKLVEGVRICFITNSTAESYEISIACLTETAHPIPAEYITNVVRTTEQTLTEAEQMQARKNQGLYGIEKGEVLVETSFSIASDGRSPSLHSNDMRGSYGPWYYNLPFTFVLDGVEYEITEKYYIEGTPVFGNRSLYKSSYDDTGEPFFVLDGVEWGGSFYVYVKDAVEGDEHTVSGYVEVVNKVPSEYLPKAAAVADAAGDTPTAAEFNALLASLRTAGLLST